MNSISFQNVYQTITQRGEFKLGQRAATPDGRQWVFVNAAGAIGKNLIAIPNTVTTSSAATSSSTDSQGRIVYLTNAAAAWTVGGFEDAVGLVSAGTGTGQTFKIRTNSATTLTLYPETALTTALSVASSVVSIINPASVIIAAITSKKQQAVGGTQVAFSSGDYGWLLTEGDGGVVIGGGQLTAGANFTTGAATAGEGLIGVTTNGPFDAQNLGWSLVANSAADIAALVRYEVRG